MKKYLIDNLEENSLAATLSRLTACDGLSFNVIATSMDLRRGLVAMGFSQVPSAVATIKQHVMAYGQRVRSCHDSGSGVTAAGQTETPAEENTPPQLDEQSDP